MHQSAVQEVGRVANEGEEVKGRQIVNGDTVRVRNGEGIREVCCSCGLTHFNIYRIKNQAVEITVYRDDSYTQRVRKERKK